MGHGVNTMDRYTVWENIKNSYSSLYAAEAKVADFILNNPGQALEANVSETAELSGVSDATVVRFCKRIGYAGFYQMKLQLSHDMGKNASFNTEKETAQPDSAQERMLVITNNIMTISKHINTEILKKCAAAIDNSETTFVIGNGYAKIIACDIMYRLTRMGIRCSGGGYSETDFENLYLGKENDVIDINYNMETYGKNSKAYINVQGALTDSAKKNFKGTIDFKEGSKKAIGKENENCILLSKQAKSKSLPMLLCHEEDVEGEHGVSSGKIDEAKLFYIMTKGISYDEARKLIIKANFNDIIKNINNNELENRINEKIDQI